MANQTPYIGSKISLISKLDIRYEGVLYTVDTNDSTIALAKVRSFGTEDRPTPNPVSARDDVYEYIIFKASDIKDLIVCETPKNANLGGLPYDPAIISVSSRAVPPLPGVAISAEDKTSPTSSRTGTPQSDNFHVGRPQGTGRGRGHSGSFDRGNNRSYRGGLQQNRGRVSNGMLRPNKGEKLKFDGDYDFEKANEQFVDMFKEKLNIDGEKSEEESGATTQADPEDAKFYDKQKSFFDNISCEALEKAEGKSGRPDWKKERETNQETFGQSALRSFGGYRRGYQRGRGGRGGYNQGYNGGYMGNRGHGRGYYRGGNKQSNRDIAA